MAKLRTKSSKALLTLALFIPLLTTSAVLPLGIWSPLNAKDTSCRGLPSPHPTPPMLVSTMEAIYGNVRLFEAMPNLALFFSNASIVVNGTAHPYMSDNSYIGQFVNSTGETNFVSKGGDTSIHILLVPESSNHGGLERAVLVTIRPPLNMTSSAKYFVCNGSSSSQDFSQPTYPPVLYQGRNLGFACPPSSPVPQNASSMLSAIESDKWFLQSENGEPFQFVFYDIHNQTGKYNNQTENLTFLEATFSYSAPSGSNLAGNGSYIYVRALLPFNGTLTRPWSLAISRFDGQLLTESNLNTCRTIWNS